MDLNVFFYFGWSLLWGQYLGPRVYFVMFNFSSLKIYWVTGVFLNQADVNGKFKSLTVYASSLSYPPLSPRIEAQSNLSTILKLPALILVSCWWSQRARCQPNAQETHSITNCSLPLRQDLIGKVLKAWASLGSWWWINRITFTHREQAPPSPSAGTRVLTGLLGATAGQIPSILWTDFTCDTGKVANEILYMKFFNKL